MATNVDKVAKEIAVELIKAAAEVDLEMVVEEDTTKRKGFLSSMEILNTRTNMFCSVTGTYLTPNSS